MVDHKQEDTMLELFDRLVTELNKTAGTNAKIEVLKRAEYSELRPLIKRIWDPDTTTGVTKKGVEDFVKKDKPWNAENADWGLVEIMDNLTARNITGDMARVTILTYIEQHESYRDLILRILEKKPRVRMAAKLILTAFPGIFKIFKLPLAEEYTEEVFKKEYKACGEHAYDSDKIDGVRVSALVDNGTVTFFSRTGQEFTSLDVLRQEIEKIKSDTPFRFDGEVVAVNKEGREDFKLTVSQVRKMNVVMKNPIYKVFDMIDEAVFQGTERGPSLEERFKRLTDTIEAHADDMPHVKMLKQTRHDPATFPEVVADAKERELEGIMIRMNSYYEPKRTKKLLKYKFFQTEEFVVEDVTIENMPFPNAQGGETRKQALKNVQIRFKGDPVSVGSGFTAAERVRFAAHPDEIRGKTISVQFQETFYDEKLKKWSLRIPIFKALIGDRRDF